MNEDALHLLDYIRLLDKIAENAHCEASQRAVLELRPLGDIPAIRKRQGRISEIMRLAQEGKPLALSSFKDVAPSLHRVRPEGAVLDAADLAGFIPVFSITAAAAAQLHERSDLPHLVLMTEGLTGFPDILRLLKRSVDHEGGILDTASLLLADLRERSRRLEVKIVRKLEEIVRDERVSVFLQDDFITKRSGRWVIPVRMDSKGQVAGVVHDVSKSGETAFMEPLTIINLANEMENLIAEQKAEEIRILRELSSRIRREADGIEAEFSILVELDTLSSVARFSGSLDMAAPEINEQGIVRLTQARHPLLVLTFARAGDARRVVPLDVLLGGATTVMIVTGSNAGGKTIAIKTIGLLVAMALSGMPIPASSSSIIPLVKDLLVDIGDEQSIEASLSTFAAHVEHIAAIIGQARPAALILIDELGTGTDPAEGAALACAVLSELRARGALVFATTHLADIKGFVHRAEGMTNASMEFDRQTLTPLYRLRVGEPGQSHALETARRYGLPERIIASARSMLGGMKEDFDDLIAELNRTRADYEERLQLLQQRKAEMDERKRLLAEETRDAERLRKEVLGSAYEEAAAIIAEVKRQMNSFMDELKRKDRAERRELLKKAEALREEVSERLREFQKDAEGAVSPDSLREGDTVFVKSLGHDATVVKVTGRGRVRVRSGNMEAEIPAAEVRRATGKQPEGVPLRDAGGRQDDLSSSRISLVGMRVDEALSRLEPFINHAVLAGFTEVTIIHGIGTGALARAVREHLTGHPLIKRFRAGASSEGGAGVTIATLA